MWKNHSLKELNTWNVGGYCSLFAEPSSYGEAKSLLSRRLRNKAPFYILGGGSNVLIQDGLLDALVLGTGGMAGFSAAERCGAVELVVEAGYPVRKLLEFAIKNNLGGFEFLTGIPGTLGGALWGNAGAAGTGFAELVKEAETIEADGSERIWKGGELNWQYRACPFSPHSTVLVTRVRLTVRYAEPGTIIEKIRFFSALKKGQPIGRKTAGCIFKNPDGFAAGKLIDISGCKGMRVGGAVVSGSHANFIENENNAAARDIYELCEKCRELVLARQGVRLEYEIRFFGTF